VMVETNLKSYIEEVQQITGYTKEAIRQEIAKFVGIKSTRTVEDWERGEYEPVGSRERRITLYLSQRLKKQLTVEDVWPINQYVPD